MQFEKIFKEVERFTLLSKDKCYMLYQYARYACRLQGEMAEVGVYKGGSARLIAKTCPNKIVHLFDTFSGIPYADAAVDSHKKGNFSDTSVEAVRNFLFDCDNVILYPGIFPSTADWVKDKQFCFVHIDVDVYQSVRECLEFFYSRTIRGGIILLDDYQWEKCPGVEKAVTEFLTIRPEILIETTRYQCVIIKI